MEFMSLEYRTKNDFLGNSKKCPNCHIIDLKKKNRGNSKNLKRQDAMYSNMSTPIVKNALVNYGSRMFLTSSLPQQQPQEPSCNRVHCT